MAFLKQSRYAQVDVVPAVAHGTGGAREVQAVKLRRLPPTDGEPHIVAAHERLDTLAQDHLDDGTEFWRIADANTELYAPDLTAIPGRVIRVPKP